MEGQAELRVERDFRDSLELPIANDNAPLGALGGRALDLETMMPSSGPKEQVSQRYERMFCQ